MWIGNRIYYTSDSTRVLNIWAADPETGTLEQITHHTEYDVRWPSMDNNSIVYEFGGTLRLLDVTTREDREIPVQIQTDVPEVRPVLIDVKNHIQGFNAEVQQWDW